MEPQKLWKLQSRRQQVMFHFLSQFAQPHRRCQFSGLRWENFEKLTRRDLEKACAAFFTGGLLVSTDMFYIALQCRLDCVGLEAIPLGVESASGD
ncbi:hypothetical protein [Pseudomonas syringae]|uniref:hypothetical protein n=1 Tax=Pseudomonas syringae TaxID=317 RepID=UPI001F39644D|nr:hypothetical protein [Pseudomonas syringae]